MSNQIVNVNKIKIYRELRGHETIPNEVMIMFYMLGYIVNTQDSLLFSLRLGSCVFSVLQLHQLCLMNIRSEFSSYGQNLKGLSAQRNLLPELQLSSWIHLFLPSP